MCLFLHLCCNIQHSPLPCPAMIFSSVIQVIGTGPLGEKGERGYPGVPGLKGEPGPKGKILPSFFPSFSLLPSFLSSFLFFHFCPALMHVLITPERRAGPRGDRVLFKCIFCNLTGFPGAISPHLCSVRGAASPQVQSSLSRDCGYPRAQKFTT